MISNIPHEDRLIKNSSNPFSINKSYPIRETHKNIIYYPINDYIAWELDPDWGIYNLDGDLLDSAAYYRGPGKNLVGQQKKKEIDGFEYSNNFKYLYGGNIIPHYGHFIISTMSRFWPVINEDLSKYKILCHGAGVPKGWFSHPFIRDIFSLMGLNESNFIVFKRPTLINEILIPRASCEEHNFCYKLFGELGKYVGNSVISQHHCEENKKPVYLSKSRLSSGVQGIVNEVELESSLMEIGVEIVHPQELSFNDQILLFNQRKIIISPLSSAIHSSIFCVKKPKILAICQVNSINSNFLLIDAASGVNVDYLNFQDFFEIVENGKFDMNFKILDTKKMTEIINDIIIYYSK